MREFNHIDGQQSGRTSYRREWQGAVLAAEQVREIGIAFWWLESGWFAPPSQQWLDEFVAGFTAASWLHQATVSAKSANQPFAASNASPDVSAMTELVNFMHGVENELGLPAESVLAEASTRQSSQFLTFMQELRRLAQERNTLEEKGALNEAEINRMVEIAHEIEILVERARNQGIV